VFAWQQLKIFALKKEMHREERNLKEYYKLLFMRFGSNSKVIGKIRSHSFIFGGFHLYFILQVP